MTTDLILNNNLRTAVEINDVVLRPNTLKLNCQLSMDMLMLKNLIKLSGDFLEAGREDGKAWE